MPKYKNFEYKETDHGICITEYLLKEEEEVIIPDFIKRKPVVEIGERAFSQKRIKNVVLPKTLEKIGKYAFILSHLNEINFPNQLRIIDDHAFSSSKLTEIELPDSVIKVGDESFSGCKIEKIELSKNLQKIGKYAFKFSCFTTIELPNSLLHIGEGAFSWNLSLKNICIPPKVKKIEPGAFTRCDQLIEITSKSKKYIVEDNLLYQLDKSNASVYKYIGDKERKIIIPNEVKGRRVENILDDAFYYSRNLEEIYLPEFLVEIGKRAFYFCDALQKVHINSQVKYIKEEAFSVCRKLDNVKLPDTIEELGKGVFYHCFSLTSINIPINLTTISENLFHSCKSLKRVELPNKIQEIGSRAFCSCNSLEDVELPDAVIKIHEEIFMSCKLINVIKISHNIRMLRESDKYYLIPPWNEITTNSRLNYIPLNGHIIDYLHHIHNHKKQFKTFDELIDSIYDIYHRVEKYQKSSLALFMLMSKDIQDPMLKDELLQETRKYLVDLVIEFFHIGEVDSVRYLIVNEIIDSTNFKKTFAKVSKQLSDEDQMKVVELQELMDSQNNKKELTQQERDQLYKL